MYVCSYHNECVTVRTKERNILSNSITFPRLEIFTSNALLALWFTLYIFCNFYLNKQLTRPEPISNASMARVDNVPFIVYFYCVLVGKEQVNVLHMHMQCRCVLKNLSRNELSVLWK